MKNAFLVPAVMLLGITSVHAISNVKPSGSGEEYSTCKPQIATKEKAMEYDTIISTRKTWKADLKALEEEGWRLKEMTYEKSTDIVIIVVDRPIVIDNRMGMSNYLSDIFDVRTIGEWRESLGILCHANVKPHA